MRLRAAFGLVALAVVIGGCSSPVVGEAVRPAGADGLFDPCSAIPDAAISDLGVDVATETNGIAGARFPRFNICTWTADDYTVSIWSTDYSLEDVAANADNDDVETTAFVNDSAITFGQQNDDRGDVCSVAWSSNQGAFVVRLDVGRAEHPVDSCGLARALATRIYPEIPQ